MKVISEYIKVKNEKYLPNKAECFEPKEIERFLKDGTVLCQKKLALLIGLFGALRCSELYNLEFQDIVREENRLVITVRSSKTDKKRAGFSYIVPNNSDPVLSVFTYFDEYIKMVPSNLRNGPFFLTIQLPGPKRIYALVTKILRGINLFGRLPREIAQLLQKTNPKQYTGHSIRRTTATWLAANGANEIQLKMEEHICGNGLCCSI